MNIPSLLTRPLSAGERPFYITSGFGSRVKLPDCKQALISQFPPKSKKTQSPNFESVPFPLCSLRAITDGLQRHRRFAAPAVQENRYSRRICSQGQFLIFSIIKFPTFFNLIYISIYPSLLLFRCWFELLWTEEYNLCWIMQQFESPRERSYGFMGDMVTIFTCAFVLDSLKCGILILLFW